MVGPVASIGTPGTSQYRVDWSPIAQGWGNLGGGIGKLFEGIGAQRKEDARKEQLGKVMSNLFGGGSPTAAAGPGTGGTAELKPTRNRGDVLQSIFQLGDPQDRAQALHAFRLWDKQQKPTGRWESLTDDAGKITGQRHSLTGEVKADPRAPKIGGDATKYRPFYHPGTRDQKAVLPGSPDAAALVAKGYVPGQPQRPLVNVEAETDKFLQQIDAYKKAVQDGDAEVADALRTKIFGRPGEAEKKSIASILPARKAITALYESIRDEDAGWWWDERGQKQNQLYTMLKSQVINLEQRGANFTKNEEAIIEGAIGQGPLEFSGSCWTPWVVGRMPICGGWSGSRS